jgi:hypothetical protein
MSYIKIIALVIMALLPSAAYAQERPAMSAHNEILNAAPNHCLDKAKLTFFQFGAGEIQQNGGFLFSGLGAGGSVVVYCLPAGNPNQSLLIIVVATAPGPLAQDLQGRFLRQLLANP